MTKRSVIAARLGVENAERLASIAGGTRLHVPGILANAGRLKLRLGDDLAILVVLHFGDSRLYVPLSLTGRGATARKVDARTVLRLTRKGWSASRIARKIGCSDRTVHAIRSPHEEQRK